MFFGVAMLLSNGCKQHKNPLSLVCILLVILAAAKPKVTTAV
jgi:hypothetical protein